MNIKKLESGKWQADIRINTKRKRKSFATKAEATRWIHNLKNLESQGFDWNPKQKEKRRLLELCDIWYELHGKNLNDKGRKNKLISIVSALGNPIYTELSQMDFLAYRATRLDNGISICTVNKELTYLKALFNFLISAEIIESNPLANTKKLKETQQDLRYLENHEIALLLETIKGMNQRTYLASLIGFATGARWSEIENLTLENIKNKAIYFNKTKNKKARTVPLSNELFSTIKTYLREHHSVNPSYETFERAIKVSEIQLPKGQMTHVMRHSFASHYIKNGGDILELKELLGHSTINMTMRYAHLAPGKLEKVIRLNPLAEWTP